MPPSKSSSDGTPEADKPGMSAGLSFRLATQADARDIEALTNAAYAKWIPAIGRKPLTMTFDYSKILRVRHVELAHENATLAGVLDMELSPGHALIKNLAVAPQFQKQGIGKALLARADLLGLKAGCSVIRLNTNAAFTENISFYKQMGYTVARFAPFRGGFIAQMDKPISK